MAVVGVVVVRRVPSSWSRKSDVPTAASNVHPPGKMFCWRLGAFAVAVWGQKEQRQVGEGRVVRFVFV